MMRESRVRRHVAGALVIGLASMSAAAGATDTRGPGKLSGKARAELAAARTTMNVLVRFRRAPGEAERTLVRGLGGRVRRELSASSRWVALELPAAAVTRLAANAAVEFVTVDGPVDASMDVARQTAGAAPADVPESGLKGAGVTIAMLDSGVAPHPEIQTLVAAVDLVTTNGPLVSSFDTEGTVEADGLRGSNPNRPALLDTRPPTVSITWPATGVHTASRSIPVIGTVSEPATIFVNGVRAAVYFGIFTAMVPVSYTTDLTATATDDSGNVGQSTPVRVNRDFSTSPTNTIDSNGHGTHVAGIMVGNGSHSPESRLAGIAPQASLVSVRVLDTLGRGMTSDALAGLQWVLDHRAEYGVRVLNLSLGHPVHEPAELDPLVQAVDALWDAGVVVVCSAGNTGASGYGTISSPCNSRKVITVGALNDHDTTPTTDDTVTTYSSRGPSALDLVAKPDILAPGNRIVSARAAGSYLDAMFPDRRVAADPTQPLVQEHFEMSGTSMAAPMVAGAAALMLEQEPSLTNATVKARLMLSARKTAYGHPFATGAGALDILGALRATGAVAQAPSPRVFPDSASGQMSFENTGVLWGNEAFSLMNLWSSAVVWTDPAGYSQPILWSSGLLWPEAGLWPDAQLWPDANLWPDTLLWPEAVMWPDQPIWSESVLWPEEP